MRTATPRNGRLAAAASLAGLVLFQAPAAHSEPHDSVSFVGARDRLSKCIEQKAGEGFEDFAGRSGPAKYLARRLVAAAVKRCAPEAEALRATITHRRYAEELRDLVRFQTNDYAVQIEAERLSAI